MTTLKNAASQLGIILGLIGSIVFTVEVGVGNTWDIIVGNDLTSETASHFTGGIDFVDRLTVTLMAATIAVGLGLIGISRSNPDAVNQIIRYAPWLGMAIGLTAFSAEVMDIAVGDFDFGTVSDATGAMYVAVTGWVLSGVASFLGNNR
jgi:hypothetical protein